MDPSRRTLLKSSGVSAASVAVAGCATATRINPAVPPLAKVIQDPSQTRPTPPVMGTPPTNQSRQRDSRSQDSRRKGDLRREDQASIISPHSRCTCGASCQVIDELKRTQAA